MQYIAKAIYWTETLAVLSYSITLYGLQHSGTGPVPALYTYRTLAYSRNISVSIASCLTSRQVQYYSIPSGAPRGY